MLSNVLNHMGLSPLQQHARSSGPKPSPTPLGCRPPPNPAEPRCRRQDQFPLGTMRVGKWTKRTSTDKFLIWGVQETHHYRHPKAKDASPWDARNCKLSFSIRKQNPVYTRSWRSRPSHSHDAHSIGPLGRQSATLGGREVTRPERISFRRKNSTHKHDPEDFRPT